MEPTEISPTHHKKTLHSKRSFGKYPKVADSPAYDASEEDNDPLTDDGASTVSIPVSRPNHSATVTSSSRASHLRPSTLNRAKHQLASSFMSDSDGVDSPTYDGDVESSTTAGPGSDTPFRSSHHHHSSSVSTLNSTAYPTAETPVDDTFPPSVNTRMNDADSGHPVFITQPANIPAQPLLVPEEPAVPAATRTAFNPAALTPEDIQAFVRRAIEGESFRKYKINLPPVGRPIRIYADGVYDLFHFGHALQLRQAKLSFPQVYLLVGVNSDELVHQHKARTVMNHAERCEAVRHCRWVDQVIAEAPWVIGADFVNKWQIDYVAHDEDPYAAEGHDDVYSFAKSQGKFIPTRRTPGVSTSELLERIVSGYRKRDFDDKLVKMGHAELKAEGSDFDERSLSSRSVSRSMSPTKAH